MVVERQAARVLLLDGDDRLLLLQAQGTYWITVGGGVEPGETLQQAAARELFEEAGLRCDPADLGEPVHAEHAEFSLDGIDYRQHNTFFVLRVPSHVVDTRGHDAFETGYLSGHRWWPLDELRRTQERYFPECLLELLP